MPYGVAAALWRMLPADDQVAVKAGYEAAQASTPDAPALPPPPAPTPAPPPPTGNVGSSSAATSTDAAGRPIFYTDGAWYYADGSSAAGPGAEPPPGVSPPPPPSSPASLPTPAPPDGSLDFGPTDTGEVVYELFSAEAPDRNDPGGAGIRLPSTSWGDFRDYFAKDQPFLGVHIRNQGRQLKGVVASDLWSLST